MKEKLLNHMNQSGLSQAAIGRALNVSTAVVNQYLQGKYKGDVASVDGVVDAYLARQFEKLKSGKITIPYVPTLTAKKISELIRVAHIDGEIVVIYGEAGIGKTSALKAYAASNSDVVLIESDPGYTAKVILEEVSKALGLGHHGSIHTLSERIIERLKDSGRLLLIDEAELLPLRALEVLRRIHDKTGIGLVLSGMPRLIVNLRGSRGELVQLYSRVGLALALGTALPDNDLRDISASVIGDDEDVIQALIKACGGNTRRLTKLLRGVKRLSAINNRPVSAEMVDGYSKMLIK